MKKRNIVSIIFIVIGVLIMLYSLVLVILSSGQDSYSQSYISVWSSVLTIYLGIPFLLIGILIHLVSWLIIKSKK